MPPDPEDPLVARLRAAGCVWAEDEAALLRASTEDAGELEGRVVRRVRGEPLEHVVGWAELCGVRVLVEPGVFVPRRRSELLVRAAAARTSPGDVVVDLCCGSGALGAVIARLVPGVEVHACDVEPDAVACARRNLAPVGGTAYVGDLYAALPPSLRGRVATIVANVPYVPSAEIATLPREARDHEPRGSLDGGADGLDFARRALAGAGAWLRTGGHVLVETTQAQAESLTAWCSRHSTGCTTEQDDDACVVIAFH